MRKVTLIGRLADNAELKTAREDKQFLTFRMACDAGYGEGKTTEWIDCTYHRIGLKDYLTKGSQIYAEGEFGHRTYKGKDGQKHTVMTCRVSGLSILVGRKAEQEKQQEVESYNNNDSGFPF